MFLPGSMDCNFQRFMLSQAIRWVFGSVSLVHLLYATCCSAHLRWIYFESVCLISVPLCSQLNLLQWNGCSNNQDVVTKGLKWWHFNCDASLKWFSSLSVPFSLFFFLILANAYYIFVLLSKYVVCESLELLNWRIDLSLHLLKHNGLTVYFVSSS